MVKRYQPNWNAGTNSHGVHDAVDGDYVRYSDYASLEAQLAKAKGKLNEIACWSQSQGLLWWQVKAREALSALEPTPPAPKDPWPVHYANTTTPGRFAPPAPKVTEGEWREVQTAHPLKGRRRSPAYFPATGEVCEVSGPNCDDESGYTWGKTTVLWQNEIFVLYGSEGFWPVLHKHEHVLFRPLTAAQEAGKP